ncbi:MAG: lipopolysaccharide transport system permease protein [Paraglaciecola psychrophila]
MAVMAVQLLFMIPLVCLLAVLVAFVRDLNYVIPTLLQFAFFCSGIFFSIETVAPEYQELFFINPMAGLIHQYRETLLHNHWPDWFYLGKILLGSALLWLITLSLYRRHEYTITRLVQE